MKRMHKPRPWSQQRTAALLHLFKTPAPPDFQTRVLERIRALQEAAAPPQVQESQAPARWQRLPACLRATVHGHPLLLATVAGSLSALLCLSSVVWWSSAPGWRPDTSGTAVSFLAVVPTPEAVPTTAQGERETRRSEGAYEQFVDYTPLPADLTTSAVVRPLAEAPETPRIPLVQERVVIPTPPSSELHSTPKRAVTISPLPQRVRQGNAGKSKRMKNSHRASKDPSA